MRRFVVLPKIVFGIMLVVAALSGLPQTPIATGATSASGDAVLADSLARMAAGYLAAEPTVQEILDSLGLNISAVTDLLPDEWFCMPRGPVTVGIIAEYSGMAQGANLMWYPAGSPLDTLLVLPGAAGPGDSAVIVLPATENVAWCFNNPPGAAWFSENILNYDLRPHARFYPTGDPEVFLMFWEDLAWMTDGDFNDLVAWVRMAPPTPALQLPDPGIVNTEYSPGVPICFDITAAGYNCGGKATTLSLVAGEGTFTPVSGYGEILAQHCFVPPSEGIYTFVFEAAAVEGDAVQDTLTLAVTAPLSLASNLLGPEISVSRDNRFTICRPETVCVPFAVSSDCELVDIRTTPPVHLNIIDSTICFYAVEPVEFCIPLVAEDGCGQKDSVQVCFLIEVNPPTDLTCPSVVDTVLCNPGFVCFPVTTSGGVPPISVQAVPPAVYIGSTGNVCMLVEQTGIYQVQTIVQNAACPPETCVTEVRARVNTAPGFVGIPDTTLTVCGTSPFCFGPISCDDAEDNITSCGQWDGPGTFDGQYWCYTPSGLETVNVVFRAGDACGLSRMDTLTVVFDAGITPVIDFQNQQADLCGPATVCVPFSIANPPNQPLSLSLNGDGELRLPDSVVCVPVSASGEYSLTLLAANNCGGADTATAIVTASVNSIPQVTCQVPQTDTVCLGENVCVGYSIGDTDGGTLQIEIIGQGWSVSRQAAAGTSDSICVEVVAPGPQSIMIIATDDCGASDTCVAEFTTWVNNPPQVTCQAPATDTVCQGESVCVGYSLDDPDGDDLQIEIIGPGWSVSRQAAAGTSDSICVAIVEPGQQPIMIVATDACGAADTCIADFTTWVNSPPQVTCQTPVTDTVCQGDNVCVGYSLGDPDGGILQVEIIGQGWSVPRQAAAGTSDSICVTIVEPGQQSIMIVATDACGTADTCIADLTTWVNDPPQVTADDLTVFLCGPAEVCVPYLCTDPNDNLLTCDAIGSQPGTASGGAYCFTPDTAGVYTVDVTAMDDCGLTTQSTARVTVVYNSAPVIDLADSVVYDASGGDTVCFNFTVPDFDNDVVSVTSPDDYLSLSTGQICLVAVTNDFVCARLIATDECGAADTAFVCVSAGPDPGPKPHLPDTFFVWFCGTGDVCVPFSLDSSVCEPITLTGLFGATINAQDSTLCLNISSPGFYKAGLIASDTCVAETAIVVINAVANSAPVCEVPNDTTILVCASDPQICLPYGATDPDGNLAFCGALDTALSEQCLAEQCPDNIWCYTPTGNETRDVTIRCTDSCGVSCEETFRVTFVMNSPPELYVPDDTTVFVCGPEELCFMVACYDPDGNMNTCEAISLGDANWDGEAFCFTPLVDGDYQWVFRAMDDCGEVVIDTFRVTVVLNLPPTISAQTSVTFEACGPETVCVPYRISDPERGPLTVTTDIGEIRDGEVCVYRTTADAVCLTLAVTDSCGLADSIEICITGQIPPPPVVTAPDTVSRWICGPGPVCYDVGVSHDRSWIGSVTPFGTWNPVDTSVCFQADTAGVYTMVFTATDLCDGTDSDTTLVTVEFNEAPVIHLPADTVRLWCGPGEICIEGLFATDPDGNLKHFIKLFGPGVFDPATGAFCFTADTTGRYCAEFTAQDSCNAAVAMSLCVTLLPNSPPNVTIMTPAGDLLFEESTELCLELTASDPNAGQFHDLEMISGPGTFQPLGGNSTLRSTHCFIADTTGCYEFIYRSTDTCGLFDQDTAQVCVRIEPPDSLFRICIDTVQSLNGENAVVKIRGIEMMEMGGYDFLICYDPTALSFSQVAPDSAMVEWEYFTYRTGSGTGCLPCGPGSLRLVGIFDMNNGYGPPPIKYATPKGPMFKLTFFVTPDRTFLNQCASISFCSYSCGDNTISSLSGDTLFLAYNGVDDSCLAGDKKIPVQRIEFCDGSICIIPPPDDRGDINLNGLAHEVADAVLFSNFFIYGHSVWDPIYKDAQILATDVNCDGLVLTISDLVRLIRIITGDDPVQACPDGPGKIAPAIHAGRITVERVPGALEFWIESGVDLGGVFVHVTHSGGSFGAVEWADDLGGLDVFERHSEKETRALALARQSGAYLPSGSRKLFSIPWDGAGSWLVEETQAASSVGDVVNTEVVTLGAGVPTSYKLEQNHPNPFNAGTQIRFRLGESTRWELMIYNVLGQSVRRFEGNNEAGYVTVEWDGTATDGTNVASGIYFARLKAADFTASKKMILLK